MQPLRRVMADDAMKAAWDKAEKAITKGKGESALKILRDADAGGNEPTTLRLAGHATWLEAKAHNNRAGYRRAASLLREAHWGISSIVMSSGIEHDGWPGMGQVFGQVPHELLC